MVLLLESSLIESQMLSSGALIKSSDNLGVIFWGFLGGTDFLVVFGIDFFALIFSARVESPSIDLFAVIIYNYSMNAVRLTKKQLAVLDFIQDFTEENGTSPSYREIMEGLGLSSVSAVAEHIDNLVAKGALKKVPGEARSLEILDYKHTETVNLFKAKMFGVTEEDKTILLKAAGILGLDLEN